jgi:tetrapyrrole methylase family protein / MazG family protein
LPKPKPTSSPLALRRLVHRLRAPGGCPWDRAQTPASLVPFVLEEAYEVADAIEASDPDALREELGDLLLQVCLQAEIAEESGQFDLADVVWTLSDKLIRRHPHVFGGLDVVDAEEVERNWERLKLAEKGKTSSALENIPRALPGLARAQEVQRRLAGEGFDWAEREGALIKLDEELAELRASLGDERAMSHELGDVLFMLAKLATDAGLDAEASLRAAVQRVGNRYRRVEQLAAERGATVRALDSATQLQLWDQAREAHEVSPA